MKHIIDALRRGLLCPEDIRVSNFNIMAVVGGLVSFFTLIISIFNGADLLNLLALFCWTMIAVGMFVYSKRTGHYRLCYVVTIILVFYIFFPVEFFSAGGMNSGMPVYFVFAVTYTVFFMEDKSGLILAACELIVYITCCLTALYYPDTVTPFNNEEAVATDIIISAVIGSVAMGVTVYIQTAIYRSEQRKTKEALEEVSRQSRAKDIFLANMNHEIRTPISIILGMSEMIERTTTDERLIRYNRKIQVFGNKLQTMIEDVFDITRIQTGQSVIDDTPYDLDELVSELSMLGNELAGQKKLSFNIRKNYRINGKKLVGDRKKLMQVFSNLVTNAVKYTKEGCVDVKVSAVEEDDGKYELSFVIKDTGIGIAEDELSRIYDIFYRADNAYTNQIQGVGIGLAIVKELVGNMGGNIYVDSRIGIGTTFTVVLRQEVEDDTGLSEKEDMGDVEDEVVQYIAPDCRILVADDNSDNLELIRMLLDRTMIKIDTATNGIDAILLAEKERYDIIVLDYMMPGMDGIDTLEQMKQKGIESSYMVLTADAIEGAAAKMIKAGFDEYITKPVNWNRFEETLLKYIPGDKIAYISRNNSVITSDQLEMMAGSIDQSEYDVKYGLKRVNNNLEMYRKILQLFADHYEQNRDKATMMFGKGEWEGLCNAFHTLKSQALGIGGKLLGNMARVAEQKLKKGDYEYVQNAYDLLLLEWKRTKEQACLLADMIPVSEERQVEHDITFLTQKACNALKNNMWLEAKEAVEEMKMYNEQEYLYNEILRMIERFEFKGALEMLLKKEELTL